MQDHIQSLMLTLVGFIITILILFFGMEIWQQNNAQLTSNALVLQELNNNRDNSSRNVHGVFAINKVEFEKRVRSGNVPTWKAAKINPDKDILIKYTYDTSNDALAYVNSLPNHQKDKVTKSSYKPSSETFIPITKVTVYVADRHKTQTYTVNGKQKQGPKIIDTITYDISRVINLRKDDATV